MDEIRFGIIGAGNMGSAHLRSFAEGKISDAVAAAVADINPYRLAAAKKISPEVEVYGSGEELIEHAKVDAVIIATPHYLHPPLATAAFGRGINVVCEKPAGVYTKQVREMNSAAALSGKLFAMMFNQRANCVYRKMRELVSTKEIGDIKRISWLITDWYRPQSYYDSGSWRATWRGEGGGVLINQCPHQLDLMQWVTGMMPKRVRAFCKFGAWHDIEVEDDVTAYLEYENGATGVFVTSTADCPGDNRFEIMGTRGKLLCEGDELTFYRLETDEREFNRNYRGGFGQPAFEVIKPETDGKSPQHVGVLNNFAAAMRGEEKLFSAGSEGIKQVEIMNAMLLSSFLDKAVELPVDEELYLSELNKRIETSRLKETPGKVLDTFGTY